MANGHEADQSGFSIDRIHDPKAANAILPESLKFALERFTAGGIAGYGAKRRLDGSFQVGMEGADDFGNVRGDIRPVGAHAVRRFFSWIRGSPNTWSKVSPFLLDR